MSNEKESQSSECLPVEEKAVLLAFARFLIWCRVTLRYFRAGTVFMGLLAATLAAWSALDDSLKEAIKIWLS